jgi:hypothetical protein
MRLIPGSREPAEPRVIIGTVIPDIFEASVEQSRSPRRHWWVWTAWIALGAAVAAAVFTLRVSREMADFDVYWRAGARAAAAEPLYRDEDGHYQLKYLPAFAVLAIPLGALPRDVAAASWFAGSVGVLAGLLAASVRLLPVRRRPLVLLLGVTILACGKFYARELLLGQVNLLVAFVSVLAALALQGGRSALAGALIPLAIVLKPNAVLLLPWVAVRGGSRAVVAGGAVLAAVVALPAVVYGPAGTLDLHHDWLDVVFASTPPNLLNPDNVSWLAMFSRWFGIGPLAGGMALVTGLVVLGLVGWVVQAGRHVRRPEALDVGLLLLVMPLLSPQGWDYVLLGGTPAVMVLVNHFDRLAPAWRGTTLAALLLIGLTFHDLMGRALYHAFMQWSGITLACTAVIGALVVLRRRQAA